MQQRYRVLRVVATILKVIAVIVLLFGILGACGSLAFGAIPGLAGAGSNSRDAFGIGVGGILGGLIVGVGALFISLLYFLWLYAFGELLSLLIALEENTRVTAERLMARPAGETALTPAPPPMPPRAGG
ncbi:MAG: hypothetical protein ACM3S0_03635 [Acidobacteriota bacterium]